MIELTVIGPPAPQGSKSFMGMANGHAKFADPKSVRTWRTTVSALAYEYRMKGGWPPLVCPLWLRMVFTLARPPSAPKKRLHPAMAPDLSKLARSTEDALQDAGVFKNDAQIVEYLRLAKVYVGAEDPDALDVPGVKIVIVTAEDREREALALDDYLRRST